MTNKEIICPICGNEIVSTATYKVQRCPYCKRQYKVEIIKSKSKWKWEAKEYVKES